MTPINPADLLDLSDFERAAQTVMSPLAWAYVSGGAGDEVTLRWNREAWERLRIAQRTMIDVSQLDTRVSLLGRTLDYPFILAPTAYHKLSHPEGEIATVKGAGLAGAIAIMSTVATVSLEDCAAAATSPLWFQLYVQPDRGFTRELVQRAEAAGYQALVLTIDVPVMGSRYRELRAKFTLPPGMERANLKGRAAATGGQRATENSIYSATLDPKLTWKDIEWLRSLTRLPIIVKGIGHPDDAELAVQAGVDGLVVSNHGGRNLDTSPPTAEVLPAVVARVAGRTPVLADGGIRRGTDILKALALGADAVLIGRPYVYGLAVDGPNGVKRIITILRRELEAAMALCGRTSLEALDETIFWK